MTPAQAKAARKELRAQIERDHAKAHRTKLRELRAAVKAAREHRRTAFREAKERCRAERLALRARLKEHRAQALRALAESLRWEREGARTACTVRLGEARALTSEVASARAKLAAERKFAAEMRRLNASHSRRKKEARAASVRVRRSESDDEVRGNIPADLVALFERVRRSIRGSDRMTRTEAFLLYAEQHPREVLAALDARTEAAIRDLEKRQRESARALRRGPPPRRYTRAELESVPF